MKTLTILNPNIKRISISGFGIIVLIVFLLSACNETTDGNKPHTDKYIATSPYEEITLEELEKFILNLPAKKRWTDKNAKISYKKNIKDLAFEKYLLNSADKFQIEHKTTFANEFRTLQRNIYSSQFLSQSEDKIEIANKELIQYFDEHIDEYNLPESRQVYNLFIANNANENPLIFIKSLRQRVIKGENFSKLAEKYSNSESRHQSGSLGIMTTGKMSKDFDNIVFNLAQNTPSKPIKTADGYHLFYVSDIFIKRHHSFESVRSTIYQKIMIDKFIEYLKSVTEKLDKPEPYFIPSQEQFRQIVKSTETNKPVIVLGDFKLSYKMLSKDLIKLQQHLGPNKPIKIPLNHMYETAYKEIIYQHMLKNNIELINPKSLEWQKQKLLIEKTIDIEIKDYLKNNQTLLKKYFEENIKRYYSLVLIKFDRLVIAKNNNVNLMPELEQLHEKLNNNEVSLSTIKDKYKGEINKFDYLNIMQIKKIDNHMLNFLYKLNPNEYSPPYTNKNNYYLIQQLDKIPAKKQSFKAVKLFVIEDYLEENRSLIFSNIRKEVLADLQINEKMLAQLVNNLQI